MLGRLIPLLPILFLLGGFFTGHIALLTAVMDAFELFLAQRQLLRRVA